MGSRRGSALRRTEEVSALADCVPADGSGADLRLRRLGGFELARDGKALILPRVCQRLIASLARSSQCY